MLAVRSINVHVLPLCVHVILNYMCCSTDSAYKLHHQESILDTAMHEMDQDAMAMWTTDIVMETRRYDPRLMDGASACLGLGQKHGLRCRCIYSALGAVAVAVSS